MQQPAGAKGPGIPLRSFSLRQALLFAAAALASVASAEERSGVGPVALAAAPVSFFIDRRLPPEFRPSVEEARRRLLDSRCSDVLADFEDVRVSDDVIEVNVAKTHLTSFLEVAYYSAGLLSPDGRSRLQAFVETTLAAQVEGLAVPWAFPVRVIRATRPLA